MSSFLKMSDSKAHIRIEPMQQHEIEAFIDTYCHAFSNPAAGITMPMVYPSGLNNPSVRTRFLAAFPAPNNKDFQYVAKDTHTGDILGISWWQLFPEPAKNFDDVDEEIERLYSAKSSLPEVEGMNVPLDRAYFEASFKERYVLPRPFMELRMLAVHPDHQGRGVGSLLVRHGLEKIDEMKVSALVISAVQGKPLYERHGFEMTKQWPFDAREYGGEFESRHWSLLRPAKR